MERLAKLPPYLFSEMDSAKRAAVAAGRRVIDLGIGDPDRPTPPVLVEAFAEAARRPQNHRYPSNQGKESLRRVIAAWLERRHGVTVDPQTQVQVLIGSKEGLGHLPLALLGEGDEVLVPDPGYPVYTQATILAGGRPVSYPLPAERDFAVDVPALSERITDRTRLLLLNYPHNPTGAPGSETVLREAVALGRDRGLVVANDAAYLEVRLDEGRNPSLLACADATTDRIIEFHSLSKMFNMTGWRVAFAVGHPEVIGALGRVKESMDSGVPGAVQDVAEAALSPDGDALLDDVTAVYRPRRERILKALAAAGIEVFTTPATFYVWARVPGEGDSIAFARRLLEDFDLVVTPGVGFGPGGEGWFRISLTAPDEAIEAGAARLEAL